MKSKRRAVLAFLTLVVVFGFVIGGGTQESHTGAANNATAGPKKAEEQFKNIQVLKGIPAEQVFPTMQFITASLGVECEFCHVPNA